MIFLTTFTAVVGLIDLILVLCACISLQQALHFLQMQFHNICMQTRELNIKRIMNEYA